MIVFPIWKMLLLEDRERERERGREADRELVMRWFGALVCDTLT